jgi:hypothetical protein
MRAFFMRAELVRLDIHQVDIKIVNGENMHVLQWRRRLFWDEVTLDGMVQAKSAGLWGREKVYGLVFGRDLEGNNGTRTMLLIDPATNWANWNRTELSGVRLEMAEGPLVAYGTLDPKTLEKPATFADWMKKSMGMEWGK